DWAKLLPLLNSRATSIYEINLANVTNPKEQVASHAYLKQLVQELN
ncbi:sugar phosphate isomerase/epimerase, partial [Enterococcus cecorum]